MEIIKPSVEIITPIDGEAVLRLIELCGRTCYGSTNKAAPGTAAPFVASLIKSGHESVLEHYSFTVRFVCDRGVSHQIVRHRIASYSQESTRYCNYGKTDGGCTFIEPPFWPQDSLNYCVWVRSMALAEVLYLDMLSHGAKPEEARGVLPSSLKTELIMTANLREWRHFFKLRAARVAHPQMRELAALLLAEVKELIPVVFDDLEAAA